MEKENIQHEDLTWLSHDELLRECQYTSDHISYIYWKMTYVMYGIGPAEATISVFRLQHDLFDAIDRQCAIIEEMNFRKETNKIS